MVKKGIVGVLLCLLLPAVLLGTEASAPQPAKTVEVSWSDEEADAGLIGTKQVIGMVEKVVIEPGTITLDARIDTGATKTSLGAEELQIVNEDGQDWALFNVKGEPIRAKVVKYVHIKQHGRPAQRRPVVMLKVILSDVTQAVEVTLSDRSNFKYRMLIGVNFLRDHFVVDVSRKFVKVPVLAP